MVISTIETRGGVICKKLSVTWKTQQVVKTQIYILIATLQFWYIQIES